MDSVRLNDLGWEAKISLNKGLNKTYKSLKKTRNSLFNAISVITGKKKLDDTYLQYMEELYAPDGVGYQKIKSHFEKQSPQICSKMAKNPYF